MKNDNDDDDDCSIVVAVVRAVVVVVVVDIDSNGGVRRTEEVSNYAAFRNKTNIGNRCVKLGYRGG